MKFLRTEDGMDFFHFRCQGCDAEGELGVDLKDPGPIGCPEQCGASYVRYRKLDSTPDLMCVVCPVYEE